MDAQFSPQDVAFMQLALDLAKQGEFTTTPNPSVGCVLVKNGKIVGKGFHFKAGEPHAEVMALREAGENARGATAYVTLEPCSHFGRTPPCAKGLVEAGVSKVIAAMCDPNPQVAGKGLQILADAGIQSAVGLLEEKAEQLNKGFLKRMRTGKPFVQLKLAMSIDGKTAMASGESKWITGAQARMDVQQYRAKASAMLSTSQTVLADDPSLNVRWAELPNETQARYVQENLRQPVRVILDSTHKVRSDFKVFLTDAPVWLAGEDDFQLTGFPASTEYLKLDRSHGESRLQALMTELGKRQINTLWVEAGATLAGALIAENLVDELIIYMAPKLLGDHAKDLCHLPHLTRLADAPLWQLQSCEPTGDDLKLIYIRK
ncbi:bifunctional diaminohydroxyphosphoribosylaminopyrimidine deaminase/5-amino-6-(5-phosphoribosylamino)uracil reductase RibD [Aggregatibacter actinomycetemcomitans]|uniref:bifunctional diaminohydroxyphosphoribosylaminopyrimidine deaminase/5-amino-6-(5-phosphoribosylamino)uracil reductase RibD n=1 Tax=Aggregatibacter actinomycetemcomitans TaxID=714 RepID=UPI00022AC0DF|nr:bifunctional diaminohydroxyphosphoribosylaminopyrimidine deaminase/5-amino-6-(5-phosphoribosylamino)uracil reductase RibD [Aggregatibacter actinomycetemcomitans]AHN72059.1 riboflavin biosynthesis protein RibD, putative [Aggregatibacter actinomycetemcomitans HK1651]KND82816.1 5-amino-6-(5-phosphoribosylamino)uracil reductase [Aggregatibacter actinomycetemcomitans serotype b str. SCC1398]KOE53219.1 5-amino-6-(5-phosphoribosylamino)uracil reductase [Aggregatibacter actinomycetemcomitans serotype